MPQNKIGIKQKQFCLINKHRIQILYICIFCVITALFGILTANIQQSWAEIGKSINYQGRLMNASGLNVSDGTYSMKISIYNQASGGSHLWSASTTNGLPTGTPANIQVEVKNGLFSILLGDISNDQVAFPEGLFNNDTLYLGITVGADSEMTPRKRLSAVPYAYNSQTLQGQYASNTVTSTGGDLFALHQSSNDSASAQRSALAIYTSGTSNQYDLLIKANSGSDVFSVTRQGSVTTTGNLQVDGITQLGSTLSVAATSSLADLSLTGRVNSNLLPYITDTYSLGNSTYRWLGITAQNVNTVNVSSTNIDALGYVSTTNLYSTESILGNATTTNLYNSGTVSTTALYVNGVAITGAGATPSWQQVTDVGATTNDWIQFAGATSTDNIVPNVTNSLSLGTSNYQWLGIYAQNADFTSVSTTNLDATGYIVTNNLTATNADLTNVSSTNIDASGYITANTLNSNTADLGNVTTTNLYNSGTVSTTNLYVNGVEVTGIEAQDFQDVTDLGVATTNWIQFAGATSTNHFLPGTNNLFNLGSLAYRWANLFAVNGNVINVSSTNIDASGYITANTLNSNTALLGNVTTTNLYNSGVVSTTSLYVNGTQITGLESQDLQDVTDIGAITSNWIQFAGATSTNNLVPTSTNLFSLGSSANRWSDVWGVAMHIGTSTWDLTQGTNGRFMVGNNNLERLTITVDGNVGIGISTPGANLVVNNGTILNYAGNSIWQSAADEDTHATFDSTMVEYNGKMYVFGGLSYDPDTFTYYTTSSLRIYDPATDTWEISSVLDTQYERYSHGAVVWDDKMLVFGGYDENFNATSSLRIYDFISETWSSGASANSNQAAHSVVLSGGTLIAYGGDDGSGFVDIVQIYDYDTDSWSYGASNSIRQFGHSAVVYGTKMYVFGGEDDDTGDRLDDIYIYDIKNDIWSSGTEDTGNFRRFHEAVVLDNKMYVFGGQDPDIDFLSDLRVYDFLSDSWSAGYSDPAFPRNSFSMAVYDGVIYVTGGLDSYSEPALITTRYLDTTNLDIVDYIASLRNMGTSELTFKSDAVLNLDIGKWSIMQGKVGIGLLNPTEDLDVYGNIQNILYQQQAFPVVATSSFANGCSGSITGGRVVGDYIYFAQTGGCQFLVAEASNPRRINPIGSAAGSNADNPLIIGNYLYLPAEEIYIYDISNPASEVMVDTYNTNLDFVYDIERYGNYILVANNGNDELTVLDITNPISPVEVANVGVGTSPWALAVQGAYAYTADQDGNSVSIVNVSNPLDPAFIDSVFLDADFRPFDVAVSGRYAYAVGSYNFGDAGDLYVIDIGNPNFASVATTLRVTTGEGGLNEIIVSGRYAYVSSISGIHVIDLIDPEDPVLLGSVDGNFQGAVLNGRYLYGTNSDNGLVYTIDVHGTETNGLLAHSAELGTLNVRQSSMFADNIFAQGGLSVGSPGIYSMGSLGVYATTSLMDLAVNGRVNSSLLPYITDTYYLGNSTYRWLGMAVANVSSTNIDASGYVSTTSLYVNGTQITGATPSLQQVTDVGYITNDAIGFAGASSTGHFLPTANITYDLGSTSFRWRNLYASNGIFTNVSSTNIDALGYVSTTNLYSNTALLGNVTTTNLYNSGVVSTTQLYVNGVAVTGIEAQDFQDVTDLGVATTNWIQFAGATSTNHFLPGTNNLFNLGSLAYRWANLFAVNGNFTGTVTTTNLFASGYVSTTSLYVNGTQITGATPSLQQVTDVGYITDDAIGFAGASSTGHFLPTANVTYDLGSSSFRWRNLYASNGIFTNVSSTNIDALGYVSTTNLYSSFGLLGNVTTTNIYNSGTVSTTALYVNGVQITGGGSGAQDLQDVTDEGYVTTNPIRVAGATSTDQLFVLGSQDAPQLIVQANATQDMENPLILFRNSAGTAIGGIHTNDQSNIFAGFESGAFITTGTYNTALGFRTMYNSWSNITGSYNTAIGAEAMWGYSGGVMSGYDNTGVGYRALATLSSGYGNTAVGYSSLADNTTGYQNNAFGWGALGNNTTGWKNVAIGVEALTNNTDGESNTSVGNESMFNNNGDDNVAVGKWAMRLSTTADQAVGIGASALSGNNATGTTGVGYRALYSNSTGINLSGVGHLVMDENTTGSNNTAMGSSALYYNRTGSGNTSLGSYALHGFTNNSHSNNTGIGYNSLFAVRTGSANTALGGATLYSLTTGASNTAIGYAAGDNITTGSNNILIGNNVDSLTATGNYHLNIGNTLYGDLNNGRVGVGVPYPYVFKLTIDGHTGPSSTNAYDLGSASYRWRNLYASNGIFTSVSTTNIDALGYVSTTDLYVNGSLISGGTPTLQDVTDEGYVTTNPIRVAGASSTGHILPVTTLTYDLGSSSNRWKDLWVSSTYIGPATWNLRQNASGYFTIANVGGSERVTVDTSGNVGIGDTTPASMLTVGSGDTFQVNSSGNIIRINGVTYNWPSANAAGALRNDGSGNFSFNNNISQFTNNSGYITGVAGQSLTAANLWVGNASNQAAAVAMSGDATMSNTGVITVADNSHAHDGTTISGLAVADFTSSNISNWTNDAGYITGVGGQALASTNLWVGNASNQAAAVAMSGDATMSNTGVVTVANDSHTHNGTTISGLAVADFTSSNISNWTNDAGYLTSANAFVQNGNSFTADAVLGTNDGYSLFFETAGVSRGVFDTAGTFYLPGSANSTRLAVRANASQTIANPLIQLQTSGGAELARIHADNDTNLFAGYLSGSNNSASYNAFFGSQSGAGNTTGQRNTAMGWGAMYGNGLTYAGSSQNVAIGHYSQYNIAGGAVDNASVGAYSMVNLSSGDYNSGLGSYALNSISTGGSNVAIGYAALTSVSATNNNTAVGANALYSNTGGNNVAVGYNASRLGGLVSAVVSVGYESLYNNTASSNMGIGVQAGYRNTSGTGNTALGYQALYPNQTGAYNTAVGYQAIYASTGAANSASYNSALGYQAMFANTTGQYNTAMGSNALRSNTTGGANVALGADSLYSLNNVVGSYNVALGPAAAYLQSSAANVIAIGASSLYNNNAGNTIGIGYEAAFRNTTGAGNLAIGYRALYPNQTGNYNTAIGELAMYASTGAANSSNNNTAVGYRSLYSNTTGGTNTAVGTEALYSNTTGSLNTAVGYNALNAAAGNGNTAIGARAMDVATGSYNTAIGSDSIGAVFAGTYSIGIGGGLLTSTAGDYNIALGVNSLYQINNTAADYNIGIGSAAGFGLTSGARNVILGANSAYSQTTASDVVSIGYNALNRNTASQIVAIGSNAGYWNTAGTQNTIMGYNAYAGGVVAGSDIGSYNTSIGWQSMYVVDNAAADFNTALGWTALTDLTSGNRNSAGGAVALGNVTTGSGNTAFGTDAGNVITTGSNNTFLGYNANATANNYTNSTAIGYNASVTASNQVRLGATDVNGVYAGGAAGNGGTGTNLYYYGTISDLSDVRAKKDIIDNNLGLNFVLKLQPRHFKMLAADTYDDGFIAQEVYQVASELSEMFNGVIVPDDPEDYYYIDYTTFVGPLVNSVQELYASSSPLYAGIAIDPNYSTSTPFLMIDENGDLAYSGGFITAQGTASTSTTTYDSGLFSLQGSSWDNSTTTAITTSFSLINKTLSATSSRLEIGFATGTNGSLGMSQAMLTITNAGDVAVSGDLTVGRRLYLGSKTTGMGSTSTYLFVDDTLGASSTYIATNADGWQASTAYDYAERYESNEQLEPGDLVTADPNGINKVKRSTSSKDIILGIVSTKPGFMTGGPAPDTYPVALAGRVPTKVSTQNGHIRPGDFLAPSDMPGVAVKATEKGSIIGVALEAYDKPGQGLISVFVNVSYMGDKFAVGGTSSVVSEDIKGFAYMKANTQEVLVNHANLQGYPIVQLMPQGYVKGSYWVQDITGTSFKIMFSESQTADIKISYVITLPNVTEVPISDGTIGLFDTLTGQVTTQSGQPIAGPIAPEPDPEPPAEPEPEVEPAPEPESEPLVTVEPEPTG